MAKNGPADGQEVPLSGVFTPKQEIPRKLYFSVSLLTGISLFGLWSLLTYGGLVRSDFLAPPHMVLVAAYEGLADGSLLQNTWASVEVIYSGFILASLVAVPLGILMGSFRIVQAVVEPITNFMRYLPVSAMIPLLILWIGIGIEEKIAVIFLGTLFQQLILIADVSARISKDLRSEEHTSELQSH